MSTTVAILTIIGGLVVLGSTAGGLWAVFRSTAQESTITRLRNERDDYLSRLNFIEPRHRASEQQVELLLAMHNPTDRLEDIATTGTETLRVVNVVKNLAEQIDRELYRPRGESSP